eukprot:SAG11_NODE_42905_length_173_cov_43.986486_1_plen_29_part_01
MLGFGHQVSLSAHEECSHCPTQPAPAGLE